MLHMAKIFVTTNAPTLYTHVTPPLALHRGQLDNRPPPMDDLLALSLSLLPLCSPLCASLSFLLFITYAWIINLRI
jgi:hypothetical protein